ncbi:NADP-dependent oxidoreductase domain-containing protein [Lipomyces mesembrius]
MPVEYRKLGSSGLRVSVPILGCMSFGSPEWVPWVLEEDKSLPILKKAYDLGITTWDTANIYSNGQSERTIAAAIKEYSIPRDELIIMTKCFYPVDKTSNKPVRGNIANNRHYVNQHDLSRTAIFNQVDDSLERLRMDYIDMLQIHRYIGASSMWCYEFALLQHVAEKNGWTKFVSMQGQYNLLPLAAGDFARSVTATSLRKEGMARNEEAAADGATIEIINRVEIVSMEKGWLMTDVALAWILGKVTSPIVGVNSAERLEQIVDANGKSLTLAEIKFLEEPYIPRPITDHY